ncbi:MAG TPA: isoleucine--tRNA ligase [Terriglobia bacterium]|nr:isoleucine--tRNA ligase [Terriglobia bacterium]
MQKILDLKSTLNLPQTRFPMKANLPQTEPLRLARWGEIDLYGKIRESRSDAPLFTFHDGPPYANGRIHLGTALNKILKDFIIKSKTQAGFNTPYLPGWDCHGLPIEINVDKELGARKAGMTPRAIRAACRRYAEKFVELQRQDFKRLGILGEWENAYLTMAFSYEAFIAEAFLKFLSEGYVYRGRKPVYWCMRDRTALAEAEVEYENHRSPSIYVKYMLLSDPARLDPKLAGRKVYVTIWTTTPWTLPASMAVAFHPDFDYVVMSAEGGDAYLLESRRAGPAMAEMGINAGELLARIKGVSLERLELQHPFLPRRVLGVLADYVTAEDGTGCVHTAPGHGREDYQTGVKYGLEILSPLDDEGRFTEGLPDYRGKTVFEANTAIIQLLQSRGALVGPPGSIEHSYPHCWRCHQPVIFRATEQWFISLEHRGLRQRALDEIKRVRWSPEWGEERISNMIATRPDWCISRQRVWGVPITVFHCDSCGKPLMDARVAQPAVELFRREGADAWYTHPIEDLAAPGARCGDCGGTNLRKEMDILDVWFDSGSSHFAVLGRRPDLPWPADVYLEGGDQYRGWFHSSLLVALVTHGAAPYRQVLTNGWTLDAQGRAMSKSLGTGVDPNELIKTHGAEIVRLWAASVDFREDVVLSPEILARLSEAYRKLRNTFRYALANLYDFDPERDQVPRDQFVEIDVWALDRTARALEQIYAAYEDYAFHRVYRILGDLATVDLSAFYFDILKDRLYTAPARSVRRRSGQTALYQILDSLVRAAAPLLSFTADEVWLHMPSPHLREASVHQARFVPAQQLRESLPNTLSLEKWDRLIDVRAGVLKALEIARQQKAIGSGLEAKVYLEPQGILKSQLQQDRDLLPSLFIVSQVEIGSGWKGDIVESQLPGLRIGITRATGEKCERCWNYSDHVGENADYPTVCERCAASLSEIEGAG